MTMAWTRIAALKVNRVWSDLENILKTEPIKLTDSLSMRHGRERRVKDVSWSFLTEHLGACRCILMKRK